MAAVNRHKHGRVRNTSFYCRDFYVRGQFLYMFIVSFIVSGLLSLVSQSNKKCFIYV